MKNLFVFFTVFVIMIATQLSSFGDMLYRNGNYIYGSDGTQYWQNGNYIYGSDGTQYWQNGNYIYGFDGSQYWQNGNYIYGNNPNKNADDEEENSSSSNNIQYHNGNRYNVFNHSVIYENGHFIMEKKDIKDSYEESSYTDSDGIKCTTTIEHKVIKKDNNYEIHTKKCIKYGFPTTTFKTITTLVPYSNDKFKISKYTHKGLFGGFTTYTDE